MAAGYCYCLGIKSNVFFLKDNKKAFILWLNVPKVTAYRQWANNVLKEYLLRGYAVHQQMLQMEQRIDSKLMLQHDEMQRIKDTQAKQQQQLDFFIRTSTPPAEMVFFEGDFYTARVALENLVRSANNRVIIIDGYVSSLTLPQQSYRRPKMAKRVP